MNELLFVAACCRWPDDEQRRSRVRDFATRVGDWDRVVALAAEHRVEGLVQQAIHSAAPSVPDPALFRIQALAEEVRRRSLQGVGEALRVARLLDANGIEYRVIKGLPVAVLAYGTVTMKNSVDLDLLVRPEDGVRTVRLIHEAGYKQVRPWGRLDTQKAFRSWAHVAKEACFAGEWGQVDLHWDLLDQPALLARLDPWSDARRVRLIGEESVPTLPDPAHLAYLAAHGAMSGWSRLKWLADFAAFIAVRPAGERERLCDKARSLTGARPVDQGLLLADRFFGAAPASLAEGGSREAKWLALTAESVIAAREPGEPIEYSWRPMRRISAMQWRLKGGLSYRLAELRRRSREEEIRFRLRLPLPRSLHWAYIPLRLPGALLGLIVRAWRSGFLNKH